MSATLNHVYGCVPATTRGKSVLVGGDFKNKQKWLYTCGQSVVIRDLKNPLECEQYNEHQFPTTVARYSPSGYYIASGDVSGTLRIWDTVNKEHILKIELKILSGQILDLAWSDDSKRIVAVGEGKEKYGVVFLFDSGSSVGEITGHSKVITTCDFKQTRPYRVATGSEDLQVNWFEGPPFKFKQAFKEHNRFVNCVRFSPDGNKLLTVGSDKCGFFLDGKTGEVIGKLSADNGHSAGIYACSWSPDSKQVLTASADKTAKIWNADTGECVKTFNVSENPQVEHQLLGCLWQADELIAIALSGDIYYLDPSNPNVPKKIVHGHNKFITALAHDPSNNAIYTGSYDAVVVKWDIATGNTKSMVGKGHTNQINRMRIQGENLVSCAWDNTVRITPLNSREYGHSITLETIPADIAVGRKDHSLIIVAITDSIVVIRNGNVVNTQKVSFQPTAIALSVDEIQVAVGGKDNLIHLYSLNGNKLTDGAVLKAHRGALTSVSYSPDGMYLASADQNRDIFVWTLANNSLKIEGWVFHSARVNDIAWSPDSLHIVSGSLDSNIYVWSIEQPDKRITIKGAHHGGINNVLFLDNNTIATSGQDCTLKTWSINYA